MKEKLSYFVMVMGLLIFVTLASSGYSKLVAGNYGLTNTAKPQLVINPMAEYNTQNITVSNASITLDKTLSWQDVAAKGVFKCTSIASGAFDCAWGVIPPKGIQATGICQIDLEYMNDTLGSNVLVPSTSGVPYSFPLPPTYGKLSKLTQQLPCDAASTSITLNAYSTTVTSIYVAEINYTKAAGPVIAQPQNTFTALFSSTGLISRDGGLFTGNAVITDTSLYTIPISGTTSPLNCAVSVSSTGVTDGMYAVLHTQVTGVSITVRTGISNTSSSFTKSPLGFVITCSKTGEDDKKVIIPVSQAGAAVWSGFYNNGSDMTVTATSASDVASSSPSISTSSISNMQAPTTSGVIALNWTASRKGIYQVCLQGRAWTSAVATTGRIGLATSANSLLANYQVVGTAVWGSSPFRTCGNVTTDVGVSHVTKLRAYVASGSLIFGSDLFWSITQIDGVGMGVGVYKQPPTITRITSGSGTYVTPQGVLYLRITMVGGGGGGGGSGATTSGGTGGNGGNTTFGTSFLAANGGQGAAGYISGNGGTTSETAPFINYFASAGGRGQPSDYNVANSSGGNGGSSCLGGAGGGGYAKNVGFAASGNSGSGGGGGGSGATTASPGSGGSAGGCLKGMIVNPASSYAYNVGVAGTAGAAGTSGFIAGAGGSGVIIIEEHYQ